jgi:hypothetical protein
MTVFHQNMASLETWKKVIHHFKTDDFLFYHELIQCLELFSQSTESTTEVEANPSNIGTLEHMLPMIRLKPEYELYDLIFGKPNRFESYSPVVIQELISLLYNPDKDNHFDKIRETMVNKFQFIL